MWALFTSERRKLIRRTQMSRCTLLAAHHQDGAGGLMESAVMQPCYTKPVVNVTANYLYPFQSLWFAWEHCWIVLSILLSQLSEFLPDNSKWDDFKEIFSSGTWNGTHGRIMMLSSKRSWSQISISQVFLWESPMSLSRIQLSIWRSWIFSRNTVP